ncbi:MAG: hypothetical protein KDB53_18775 [Planctomycetes bacterium]|nr:hypothetical protein [Planctomycetota bacterium]
MAEGHITIIGRYDSEYPAHRATREAIIHAERTLGSVVNTRWITPDEMEDLDEALAGTRGALIAPRNPKTPRQLWPEILGALGWLRENDIPTLAIEYGYQHLVIEAARHLLGKENANSLAYDEHTPCPVITLLDHDDGPIDKFSPREVSFEIEPDSRLAEIYGHAGVVKEEFRGHYVLNPDYASDFAVAGVKLSARGQVDEAGFLAALEWPQLRFCLGVAWLPQNRSRSGAPHPLFRAFVAESIR